VNEALAALERRCPGGRDTVKGAQEALLQAQSELAHVTRVTTLGALTAWIAHEINQPLAGIITNGEASLRCLGHAKPNLDEAAGRWNGSS
jgi:C4-dicarboxylate-specific signal transduction histidine kinase